MTFPEITDFHNAKQYADAVELPMDRGGDLELGQVYVANDSRFTASAYNQPLTTFAVGGWNKMGLDDELRALVGTPVQVPRRFSYKAWVNAEAFKSETTDDLRAIGADFKAVSLTNTEVETQIANRGLIMVLDADEVAEGIMTEQMAVQYLSQRLKLNQIRRAAALIVASATDTARTWSSGTLDADMNIMTAMNAYHIAAGIDCNTLVFGRTAWTNRLTTLRALATAGGFAGAGKTAQELADWLNVGEVFRSNAVYQSASATKTLVTSTKILFFNKSTSGMREDPSNIKYFWSPVSQGGSQIAAFRYEEGRKKIVVGVEHNELLAVTYTGGIQTITAS